MEGESAVAEEGEVAKTAKVLSLSGEVVREIVLPPVFMEEYRPDLIKRAVLAAQANRLQPYGASVLAGRDTSAESWGPGYGVARVPRIKTGRRAARVPQAVGGRRAHPPKPEKILSEKINKKERRKALRSAIAATADESLVRQRGHKFSAELPIVMEDAFEGLKKTRDVKEVFERIGVWEDVLRAKERKVRAGIGKMRGRRYKTKKSVLIVFGTEGGHEGIRRAARNLPGVDVVHVRLLNAELLAPGTHAGRLTVWTESAIRGLESFA
ncbi:MAG: Ribosomal protein L4 [Candidatus Alkanophagales archaeon MCA70_species_1]|nr:Ribosomal protein L4 [Candidatus Alkanophaga volatiphilum]